MNPNSNIPLSCASSAGIQHQQNQSMKAGEGSWQIIPWLDDIRGWMTAGTVTFNSRALLARASRVLWVTDTQVHIHSSLTPKCHGQVAGTAPPHSHPSSPCSPCSQHWLDLPGFLITHQRNSKSPPAWLKPSSDQAFTVTGNSGNKLHLAVAGKLQS